MRTKMLNFVLSAVLALVVYVSLPTHAGAAENAPAVDLSQRNDIWDEVGRIFARQEFGNLESMFSEAREQNLRLANGTWRLSELYRGLSQVISALVRADPLIGDRIARWRDLFPDRPTPRIAEAMIYIERVKARGGLRNFVEVPDLSHVSQRQDLETARALLLRTREITMRDPHAYVLLGKIGVMLRTNEQEFFELMEEGLAKSPFFYDLYATALDYFLPKWGGRSDGIESWLDNAVARTQAEEGETLYARLAAHLFEQQYGPALFKSPRFSWERTKAGIAAIMQQYPSHSNAYRYAALSCLAGDLELSNRLMLVRGGWIEGDPPLEAWRYPGKFALCIPSPPEMILPPQFHHLLPRAAKT